MSHDPKCTELALHFLTAATTARGDLFDTAVADLADDFQSIADDFLRMRQCEKCAVLMSAKHAIHAECPSCRGAP